MPANKWIAGARPRTLPAAIAPVLVGTALRHTEHFQINLLDAVLALLVSLALQVGVNYSNDYSDGVRGTDAVRVGPVRLVGSGLATAASVKRAAFIAFGFAAAVGLLLSARSSLWFILLGAICIPAAWYYTGGKNPYGYQGFGEVSVFFFFGLVATIGSYSVQSHRITWQSLLVAMPVGALACAILAINNLRDLPKDALVNKRTLAVRLGDEKARQAFIALLLIAHLTALAAAVITPYAFATLLLVPTSMVISRSVMGGAKGAELIPLLGKIGKLHLLLSSTLALALLAKR